MKMTILLIVIIGVIVPIKPSADEYADVTGLAYYELMEGDPPTLTVDVVDGATVQLYKREESRSGWETFGSSTTTDEDGFYLFEDVNITSLCEHYDWFKIELDASEDGLPEGWDEEDPNELIRYSHKEPLTDEDWAEEWAYEGAIRVDFIFERPYLSTPPPDSTDIIGIEGHLIAWVNNKIFVPTGGGNTGYGYCPVDNGAECYLGGCLGGHWYQDIVSHGKYWGSAGPAYAWFKFHDRAEPPKMPVYIADCYYYWDVDWPLWALHEDVGTTNKIAIDFIDLEFPPSSKGGQGDTESPVETTNDASKSGLYEFALHGVRPNPCHGSTVINFTVPEAGPVTLSVYDIAGRKVSTPVDGHLGAGEYEINVTGLAPGLYIYRLVAHENVAPRKIVVVK